MSETRPTQIGVKLQIDSEVTRRIRQHARAHMKTEVCGVLIGEVCDDTVEVQASIEASSAAQAGTHVTFTQDAWEEIYRVKDETYPDHRIVGWYHSHPDHPARPSEYDREHAWPWYSYVIVSVAAGKPQDMTSWLLAADRAQFHEEQIERPVSAPPAK